MGELKPWRAHELNLPEKVWVDSFSFHEKSNSGHCVLGYWVEGHKHPAWMVVQVWEAGLDLGDFLDRVQMAAQELR